MKRVDVQIVTYAPTVFYHCQHCEVAFGQAGLGDAVHREQAREALPADLRADFQVVSDWVHGLIERYGEQIRVRVVDAASIEGFAKSLRHRIKGYPALIVDGKTHRIDSVESLRSFVPAGLTGPSQGGPA